MRGVVVASVLAVATIVVPAAQAAQHEAKKTKTGGSLSVVTAFEPTAYDPVKHSGVGVPGDPWQQYAVYDVLVFASLEKGGEVVPKTAKSLTSPDGRVWTLKLRKGIKFTDGTDYDAEAVKFNIERIQNPDNAPTQLPIAQQIESMEVTDAHTLVMTLKAANADWPAQMVQLSYVASPTAIMKYGESYGTSPETTVGAGPFTLKEWVKGSRSTFERNKKYWKKNKPKLDEITISLVTDPAQRLNTAISGGADVLVGPFNLLPSQVSQAETAGFRPYVEAPFTIFLWNAENTTVPPFDDVRVRKGVQQAIDWEAYNSVINSGGPYTLDYHIVRKPSPFYEADLTLPKYDPDAAQAFFDDYFADTGNEIEIQLRYSASGGAAYPEFMQAQLDRYDHVKVTPDPFTFAQFFQIHAQMQFGLTIWPSFGFYNVDTMFNHFHGTGSRAWYGYQNDELDAALEKGRTSTNLDDRIDAYKTMQEILIDEQVGLYLPVVSELPRIMVNENVRGFKMTTGNARWEKVRIKQS